MSTFLNNYVFPLVRTPKRLMYTTIGLLVILAMIDPMLVSDLIDVVVVNLARAFGPLIAGLMPIVVIIGGFVFFWWCIFKPKKTESKKKQKRK